MGRGEARKRCGYLGGSVEGKVTEDEGEEGR